MSIVLLDPLNITYWIVAQWAWLIGFAPKVPIRICFVLGCVFVDFSFSRFGFLHHAFLRLARGRMRMLGVNQDA